MGETRSSAQQLTSLASAHVPELEEVIKELQTLDESTCQEMVELDELVMQVAHPPSGSNLPEGSALAAIRADADEHLDNLIKSHTQMAALGTSVYQVVEDQVHRIDGVIQETETSVVELRRRIEDLTPDGLSDAACPVTSSTGRVSGRATGKRGRSSKIDLDPGAAAMLPTAPLPAPNNYKPFTFHLPGREPFSEFVDPMEPMYCFCQQPSQGDMIGCDGDNCKHEWFHWPCVGITEEPAHWLCENCSAGK